MNILEFTTLINTIGVLLAENWDDDELALMAAVFTQIGDVLATIAVIRAFGENKNSSSESGE